MPSTHFPFLDLPPEIREKIYHLICHQSAPISLRIPNHRPQHKPPRSFPHALLQTCTLVYNELRLIYFTHNIFTLSIHRRNDDWSYFLSPSFLDKRRQIRRLKVIIFRFGGHDFFTKEFIPVLEDCIMNGKLEDLEVVVKEAFLKGAKDCEDPSRCGHKDSVGLEMLRDWVALKRVMLDPYLERKVLRSGKLDFEDTLGQCYGTMKLSDATWMLGELGGEQSKAYGERLLR